RCHVAGHILNHLKLPFHRNDPVMSVCKSAVRRFHPCFVVGPRAEEKVADRCSIDATCSKWPEIIISRPLKWTPHPVMSGAARVVKEAETEHVDQMSPKLWEPVCLMILCVRTEFSQE